MAEEQLRVAEWSVRMPGRVHHREEDDELFGRNHGDEQDDEVAYQDGCNGEQVV